MHIALIIFEQMKSKGGFGAGALQSSGYSISTASAHIFSKDTNNGKQSLD